MGTAARKARKRAGVPFVHPVKVGTPLVERAGFTFMQSKKAAVELLLRGVPKRKATQALDRLVVARQVRVKARRANGQLSRKRG